MRLVNPYVKLNIEKCTENYLFTRQLDPTLCLNTYLCAHARKCSKNISFERMYLEISKGITQELWYPNGTGIETIKCKPSR